MQIKGKQIKDSSITQNNLNVTTDSIVTVSAVTNAEYVNTNSVNRVEALTYATLNLNMVANNATVGELACDIHVIEFPISNVMVNVNNINVTVGETADCYFSPDGITKRISGNALKGDYLYWNSTRFDLDITDEIDFIYITSGEHVTLAGGTTVTLDPYYPALNVKYTGNSGTTMTVNIDGISFTCGNVADDFVWDIGGANEHTFTYIGESWLQTVNTIDYTIWYDGLGSLLFSLKKGNFVIHIEFLLNFNSYVKTFILDSNNDILVGGYYTSLNPYQTTKTCILDQNGNPQIFNIDNGFNNNQVNSIIQDSNGKYVMGGDFTSYKGLTQNYICRLNQDGSLDSTFAVGTGFNGTVYSIIQDTNGKYIICGGFTTYKGLSQNYICRLEQNGDLDTSFVVGTGFNNIVYSIIQDSNGKYVIGGQFTTYKGLTQNRICRLEQNGTLDSTFVVGTGFGSIVRVIIQDTNGKYIIGGDYTTYKSATQNRICRLEQNGNLDTSFVVGTGFGNRVYTIIQDSNGKYVIGGQFTTYKGLTQNRICRLEQNGDLDTSFVIGTGFTNNVLTIKQTINNMYIIGGDFTQYNELSQNFICKLNQNGSIVTTFDIGVGFDNSVQTIIIDLNSNFIIGGNFLIYKGQQQNRICRFNKNFSQDNIFNIGSGFNEYVQSIMQDSNGKYVIGGYFTTYKGLSQNYICRLNKDGSLDSTFVVGSGFNSVVYSIIQDSNGKYVIGGMFTTYKGLTQNYICRLNQDGSLDSTFVVGTGFNGSIRTIIQDSNDKYVIGGDFTTYKGLTQNRICRLEQNGDLDASFAVGTGFNNSINTILQDSNGKYVIGGSFTTYKGLTQNRICRLEQNGDLDASFAVGTGFNNYISKIISDYYNNYIIGGNFTTYKGLLQYFICKIDENGMLI